MATMFVRDPLREMLTVGAAMDKLFNEIVTPQDGRTAFTPALDLSETAEAYTIELALAGLKPEELEISVENQVLTVRGEIKRTTNEEGRQFHRIERRTGSFARSLRLPRNVQADAISADLTDGVLRLAIPKAEEVKPRKISIGVGQPALNATSNN